MTDYDALYRRLWQTVQAREGRIDESAALFAASLVQAARAEGWQLGPESEAVLAAYWSSVDGHLQAGISDAIAVVMAPPAKAVAAVSTGAAESVAGSGGTAAAFRPTLQSDTVLRLTEEAFSQRWQDGKNLSSRLWAWKTEMRAGVERELAAGVKSGAGVNQLVYDMQRAIEKAGSKFETVYVDAEDWVSDLAGAGRRLIHNPETRAEWESVVRQARRHMDLLKESGTRHAAVKAFQAISKAVKLGREDLLGKALKWWAYDKQLYLLKRIARTEMATAAHRAVIAGAENDATIIGFQWRLSASHPAPDICDYYANIEMGLGRGVWTKDAVPRHKAHPHCMCLLLPRVTPVKTKGSASYADFMHNLSPEKRAELLPQWANRLHGLGVPLDRLVRPDGLGLTTREEMAALMGQDKFQAAEALGKALSERRWPESRIRPGNRMSRATLDALEAHSSVPEVRRYLADLAANDYRTPSRTWHYFKYKYQYGDTLSSPAELDARFDTVLRDRNARVYRGGERYIIYSERAGRWAIVQPSGARISVYQPTDDELKRLGEPLWAIHILSD
ncbi:MAG: hypothetical protein EPN21_06300 [Methylococcaceae bacterium]|nr:MAG: hypothetical protein EPN21_06300 [Methylococcaceae bacterium]